MNRCIVVLVILILIAGCAPAAQQNIETLPTIASLDKPPEYAIEGAERVALEFLSAWQNDDLPTMYSLISFASQEATSYDTFASLYQIAQEEMTLRDLRFAPITLYRERDDVTVFNYQVTFETNLLGDFSDAGRNLRLVVDPRASDWRVAWSPGDIFTEMEGGPRLRLEISAPSRANIYDRDGNILADQNGRIITVSAVKQNIADWTGCLPVLSSALNKQPTDLQKIYDESALDWLMVFGTMETSAYDQTHTTLESLCAARFDSRPVRRYLNGTLAPHILGYVGYVDEASLPAALAAGFNQDSILGRSGIEQSWDETLRGRPGGRLLIMTQGSQIVREVTRYPSQPAESVWLTLDSDLQTQVEKIIADAYTQAKDGWATTSKGAAAVVMNVNSGEILAMVSYPTFDNNAFNPFPSMGKDAAAKMVAEVQADPRRPQLNRVTQGLYPLGSVMKTVSAVAIADTGVYALDQRYTCIGVWNRDIRRVDWLAGGHGTLTLPQALTHSCNPYFYEVGYQINQVDPWALPAYMKRVGFGGPTGLTDLPEAPGLIPDPDWKRQNLGYDWNFSDAVNIAIGQGEVSVTPLQVVRWFAAIANDGHLMRPQLVKQVGILGEAPSYTMQPEVMADIGVKPEVLAMVRQGLCDVTSKPYGTAEYQFRNYPDLQNIGVCGKTGTAQDGSRPDAVSHAWFAAWAPRENPEIAVVVMVENSGEGSGVAAPIARDILRAYFFGSAS